MSRTQLPVITNCDDCGACCTGQAALPVHLTGDGALRLDGVNPLPGHLRDELRAAVDRFHRDGWPPDGSPCIWYDAATKRCKHYEYRPTTCRDEVMPGDEACRRWRKIAGVDPTPKYSIRNGRLVRS